MSYRLSVILLVSAFLAASPGVSRASCGCASCPADTASWEQRQKGQVTVGYQFEYVEQDQARIGAHQAATGEIRGHHDEQFTVTRLHRFTADVDLTDRLGIGVRVPYISRSHDHIHHHRGQDILESWDIQGFGDLSVLTRYLFWQPENPRNPSLTAIVGGEFPTGSHHEVNDNADEAELGIQPGSDSWDFIAGLSSLQLFEAPMLRGGQGRLPFFTQLLAQFNGAGNDRYRLGDTLQVNAGVAYPVVPQFSVLAQLNFLLRDRDSQGNTGEEIQKTGGEALYVSPGFEVRPAPDWRIYALIQLPVYQRVNSIQIVSDYNVLFGATYRFQAFGEKREK